MWMFNSTAFTDVPPGAHGFVYLITNTITDRKYVGRKYFTRKLSRPPLKGKKRKRVTWSESNWKEYTSSSDELKADIDSIGIDKFSFQILHIGFSKGEVNYLEENYQHKLNVLTSLLSNGTREYYNSSIGSRKFIGVKHTSPEKSIISENSKEMFG